jgi:hypothetical protein
MLELPDIVGSVKVNVFPFRTAIGLAADSHHETRSGNLMLLI